MLKCPKCGAEAPDDALFCGECGERLTAPVEEEPVQEEPVQEEAAEEEAVQEEPVQEEAAEEAPVQEAPVQQAPAQPVPPVSQAQPVYGAVPPPKAPGAFGDKMKGLWKQVTSQPSGQVDFNLLRIISIILAVGFVLFSLGLCSRFYYNRNIGEQIEDGDLKSKDVRILRDVTYQTFRTDIKGLLKTAGYTSSAIKELSKDDLATAKEALQDEMKDQYEEYGFSLTMYKFGTLYGSLFLWIGLVIVLGAAAFWWLKGGRPGNFKQAVVLPALIAAGAVFLVLFILNLSVETSYDAISNAYKSLSSRAGR